MLHLLRISSSNLLSPFFPFCIFLPLTIASCFWLFFYTSCFLPLTPSGFFNGMLEVFKPRALSCFTFFCPISLTLSTYRNSILTHLPLSGFLHFLLCVLTAPTLGLAFSHDATHASNDVIFIRQDLSFPELSTSFLSLLDRYSDNLGVSISLTTPPRRNFLMPMLPLFAPFQQMAELTPFLPPFFPPLEISSLWGTSIAITPSGTQEVLLTPVGRKYSTGSSLLTSFPSTTLTYLTLFHCSSGSCSSPDISFATSSLTLSCSWEVLQDLSSDHLPILLSALLSLSGLLPQRASHSFSFLKAHWDDFDFYFDFHCPCAEEYSSLSSAAALFTSLALNGAKSSIPFSCIKRYPKAW